VTNVKEERLQAESSVNPPRWIGVDGFSFHKLAVRRVVDVRIHLGPDDWGLYADQPGRPPVRAVAQILNDEFVRQVELRRPKNEVRKAMESLMGEYAEVGACDGDCIRVLERLLDVAFPDEIEDGQQRSKEVMR